MYIDSYIEQGVGLNGLVGPFQLYDSMTPTCCWLCRVCGWGREREREISDWQTEFSEGLVRLKDCYGEKRGGEVRAVLP